MPKTVFTIDHAEDSVEGYELPPFPVWCEVKGLHKDVEEADDGHVNKLVVLIFCTHLNGDK